MKKIEKFIPILMVISAFIIAGSIFFAFFIPKGPHVNVYFLKKDKLAAISRPLNKNDEPISLAIAELLKGPTKSEKEKGYFSEIPIGTQIVGMKKEGNELGLIFNEKLENYGGGSFKVRGLIAQIVYTFTEVAKVKKVRIFIDGKDQVVLGGEGYIIDKSLSRDDVKF